MPGSSEIGKQWTMDWIKNNESKIKKVIDLGVGGGTYRWMSKNNGLLNEAEWTGVEVWKPYIEKFNLIDQYDSLINKDIRKLSFKKIGRFNLAILGDVLEHMTKEEAIDVVNNCLENCDRVIISLPITHFPQGEYEGNKYEIHIKDDWSDKEVRESFPNIIEGYVHQPIGVYILGKTEF